MREAPWTDADVSVATDCIDIPLDNRRPLTHCDFNTGLVYLRANAAVREFADRWHETVANAKETRIRDQARSAWHCIARWQQHRTTSGGAMICSLGLLARPHSTC